MLLAKSTDGGQSFSTPVVVSNYYELPDCLTYQNSDPGRACVPEKGPSTNSVFRAANYPSGAVNPQKPIAGRRDARRRTSTRTRTSPAAPRRASNPTTLQALYNGVKTAGRATTTSSSASRTTAARRSRARRPTRGPSRPSNPDPCQAKTDQFWQWEAFDKNGKLGVDYYDRQYGKRRPPPRRQGHAGGRRRQRRSRAACPQTSRSRGAPATTRSGGRRPRHVVVDAGADAVPGRERPGAVLRRLHRDGRRRPGGPDLVATPATRSSSSVRAAARRRSAPARTRRRPATSSRTTRTATWRSTRSRRSSGTGGGGPRPAAPQPRLRRRVGRKGWGSARPGRRGGSAHRPNGKAERGRLPACESSHLDRRAAIRQGRAEARPERAESRRLDDERRASDDELHTLACAEVGAGDDERRPGDDLKGRARRGSRASCERDAGQ